MVNSNLIVPIVKSDITVKTAHQVLDPILGVFTIRNLKDCALGNMGFGNKGYVLVTLEKNLPVNDKLKESAATVKTIIKNNNGFAKIFGRNIISVVQTVTAAKNRV